MLYQEFDTFSKEHIGAVAGLALSSKSILLLILVLSACVQAASVEFELLKHTDNNQWLPQPKGLEGVSGDHLLQTDDDIWGSVYNSGGCFSFNFMNPVGIKDPCYPPGYTEGIHSMTGSMTLNINCNTIEIISLAFEGDILSWATAYQWLVQPSDPATSYNTDGIPNGGTYAASADANWAFDISFDWYYDTPYGGPGTIDMTFDNYNWTGFIIPLSKLSPAGMTETILDDPLGYLGGTSENFESWLLDEVVPRLPQDATCLLFAQGEAHPVWSQCPGMKANDGIVGETIIGYTVAEFSPNRADIDKDWDVDFFDYAILASQWQQIPGEPSTDIAPSSGDGFVDINDLAFLVENWLWGFNPNKL
ncbi:MAG: hypothetical protein ABIG61_00085 [Planctomycetota bacterium]